MAQTTQQVLTQYALELAARYEVDAHALLEEGRDEHHRRHEELSGSRFGLEMVAAFVAQRPDGDPPLRTLVEHHEFCGGGGTYRPGPRVRAVLESITASRDDGEEAFRHWVQAALAEMGRPVAEHPPG